MPSGDTFHWTPFECDGRVFEYSLVPSTQVERLPGQVPYKRRSIPVLLLIVRKPGTENGPAMVYPQGTVATVQHAIETARLFWSQLA